MQFNESKLTAAIETARTKANGNRTLLNAIDKAAIGLRGAWIVTELQNSIVITTESENTYFANGSCQCKAYENGMVCKHRVAYRVLAIYHELKTAPAVEAKPAPKAPTITRSTAYNRNSGAIRTVRCEGWLV
jgi:hypothetical protein